MRFLLSGEGNFESFNQNHPHGSMKIKQILSQQVDTEDAKTSELFISLSSIRKQGYLTKTQLLWILHWKSPRPLRHYQTNDPKDVKEITALAFSMRNELLRMHLLTALNGVNYPAASAILMFYDRKRYPVLDIRVWQQLYKAGLVHSNPRGQNFSLQQWLDYLSIIRKLGKQYGLTARQVEKRLFDYDRSTRKEKLYSTGR